MIRHLPISDYSSLTLLLKRIYFGLIINMINFNSIFKNVLSYCVYVSVCLSGSASVCVCVCVCVCVHLFVSTCVYVVFVCARARVHRRDDPCDVSCCNRVPCGGWPYTVF